jgi:hypothetical protein
MRQRSLALSGMFASACLVVALVACRSTSSAEGADAGEDAADLSFGPGGPTIDPFASSDASLPMRVAALFGTTCQGGPETSCHGSGAAGLHLVLGGNGGDVVNVRSTERPDLFRVNPGEPMSSYLFLKVAGDGGIDGDAMPPDQPHDPRIPGLVGQWISEGAAAP